MAPMFGLLTLVAVTLDSFVKPNSSTGTPVENIQTGWYNDKQTSIQQQLSKLLWGSEVHGGIK